MRRESLKETAAFGCLAAAFYPASVLLTLSVILAAVVWLLWR